LPAVSVVGYGRAYAKDGNVHVATADHAEGLDGVEDRGARKKSDGLLAGIDDVGVDLLLGGQGAHAEDTVLGLEPDLAALGHKVRDEGRHTDAEVGIASVRELLGGTLLSVKKLLL